MSKKIILDLIKLEEDFLNTKYSSETLAVEYGCSPNTILRNLKKICNPLINKKIKELNYNQYNKVKHLCDICNSDHNVSYTLKMDKYLCRKHRGQFDRLGKILEFTKNDDNEIIEHVDYAEIILYDINSNKIGIAIIDSEDIDKIKKYKWYKNTDGYVISTDEYGNFISLHRTVLGIKYNKNNKIQIDHKDRNTLNNRKDNLREATPEQNSRNCSLAKNNKSGITGVHWNRFINAWVAQIKCKDKTIRGGSFYNKEDAIKSRLSLENKYFGIEFSPQRHLFKQYNIN